MIPQSYGTSFYKILQVYINLFINNSAISTLKGYSFVMCSAIPSLLIYICVKKYFAISSVKI